MDSNMLSLVIIPLVGHCLGLGFMATSVLGLVAAAIALKFHRDSQISKEPKTVLVTGGASGLGLSMVKSLLAMGDTVIAADINQTALDALEKDARIFTPKGARIFTVCIDVTSVVSVKEAVKKVEGLIGPDTGLDAIVNSAGLIFGGPMIEIADKEFELVMDVNVKGVVFMNKYFSRLLLRNKGRIVNISSEVAYSWLSAGFNAPYSMSKFAIEAYSTSLRQELRPLGIKVVVINPGAMRTPMLTNQLPGGKNTFFEIYADKTGCLFSDALRKGSKIAARYMEKNGGTPELIAGVVVPAIHAINPKDRYIVNMSLEMWAVKFIPQFVLDSATSLMT